MATEVTYAAAPRDFDKLFKQALLLGAFAVGGSLISLGLGKQVFFSAYLQGYCLLLSLPLGCLGLTMLHNLVGGVWGESLRKYWAIGIRTLPFMAVLFVPILAGARDLYSWASPEASHDSILAAKHVFLNIPAFAVRAVIYFAVWIGLGVLVRRESRPQGISGFGIVLFVLTVTFASFDWLMSLEPHWFSSIFGALYIAGTLVSTLAFLIIWIRLNPSALGPRAETQLHDLGKLLFMSVMLWAYLSFSQYLIIWSAHLPEEMPWYHHRSRGGWQIVGALLIGGHFILPFLLLLSRRLKKNLKAVSCVAIFLLVMRFVDVWWLVAPAFTPEKLRVQWVSGLLPLGIGALWFALFLRMVSRAGLVPSGPVVQPRVQARDERKRVEHPNDEPQDR